MARTVEQIDMEIEKHKQAIKAKRAEATRLKARVNAEKAKQYRAADTRRKILAGAFVLSKQDGGSIPSSWEQFRAALGQTLTRSDDRELFGFDLPGNAETQQAIRDAREGRVEPTSIEELRALARQEGSRP